jgi:large-conductance mechanosensitive channel
MLLDIKVFIIHIIILIIKFLKEYTTDFIKFLLYNNIIQTCIGILLSSQVLILANTITDNIINPILKKLSFTNKEFEDIKYNRFGIKFQIGKVISNLITFIIIASIIFYIWKLTSTTNLNFVNNTLNNIHNNLKNEISHNQILSNEISHNEILSNEILSNDISHNEILSNEMIHTTDNLNDIR